MPPDRHRGLRALALLLLALTVTTTAAHAGRTAPGGSARFASTQYGYSLVLPAGWRGIAASTRFPGGDIDHTASYVDSFSPPGQRLVFALGRRTATSPTALARAHGRWLTGNRPCRALGPWRQASLAGEPARVASFVCEGGVDGQTLVAKWVVVRHGLGLIFTQFTPDGRRVADEAALRSLLRGLVWAR